MVRSGELLTVVTPSRCTSSGRRGIAWLTRFCTSCWARSGGVPSLKVTVSVIRPSEVACEAMYSMPSTPLICSSIGAATVSAIVCGLAPGYVATTTTDGGTTSGYSEVVPPSVVVVATYPGANPQTIAETVAAPIEEQINGVEGMLYMASQATSDGLMTLTVTFKLGTPPDLAQQLVQNRVNQAIPRLPEEVQRLGVTTTKSSSDLTMVVHLLSPNNRYDMTYLRNYAVLNVKDRLARLPG